jgi:hypothetical protein
VRFPVFNGQIECRWSIYELFDGKRADLLESNKKEAAESADPDAAAKKRGTRPRIQRSAPSKGEA